MSLFKRLGASFALPYLARRLAGETQRTAFREAGIGAVMEETFQAKPELGELVEIIAKDMVLASQIDNPVEMQLVNKAFRPNSLQFAKAQEAVDSLTSASIDELMVVDQELHEFELGIVEAREAIHLARRAARLDK